MGVFVGSAPITNARLGSTPLAGVYLGNTKIWPTTTPIESPDDIANLALWLDASDASTFSFSSGTSVSEWRDKGPQGIDFDIIIGTAPTRNATVNGLTAVNCNNAGAFRASGTHRLWDATSAAMRFYAVVSTSNNTTDNRYLLHASPTTVGFSARSAGSGVRVDAGDTYSDLSATGLVQTNTPYIFSGAFYGITPLPGETHPQVEAFFNGASNGASTVLAGSTPTSGLATIRLGTDSAESNRWRQYICEVICYSRTLDITENDFIMDYLATKWGITLP